MITVFAAAVCLQQTAVSAAAEFSDGIYTFKKTEHGTAVITDCNLTDEEINVPYNVLDYGDTALMSNLKSRLQLSTQCFHIRSNWNKDKNYPRG